MTVMIDCSTQALVSKSFTVNTVEMLKHSVSKVSKGKESINNCYKVQKSNSRLVSFD